MRQVYGAAVTNWRDCSSQGRAISAKRRATELKLDGIARGSSQSFKGTVLLDGMWDNPNYWFRYSLLRTALGLAHGREVGVTGEFKRRHVRATFRHFGITEMESFRDIPVSSSIAQRAEQLIRGTKSAKDILAWELPEGVHPAIVYDGILKRQRLASVDIADPYFGEHVRAALASIERGRVLLDRYPFDLVVITHPLNFTYGALAWQALSRGIPVVLPFGAFGTLRFTRFRKPSDLFDYHDRPDGAEMAKLSPQKAEALREIGRDYLSMRMGGKTDDLASQYSFQRKRNDKDRAAICSTFGWDPAKPIVGFYSSNWYDWPHQLGMSHFTDFLDWTSATYDAALANDRVNWLFKSHPAEEWFGGIALKDVFQRFGHAPHIALADTQWSGVGIQRSLDALLTYHGSGGIEFAASGKPVLVPDRGNYDTCGFVKVATSRQNYLDMMSGEWWSDIDLDRSRRNAEIFAGWWFCMPEWQGDFVLGDDASQDRLYDQISDLLDNNGQTLVRELSELADWWESGDPYYHTRKMRMADGYRLSNVKGAGARKVA